MLLKYLVLGYLQINIHCPNSKHFIDIDLREVGLITSYSAGSHIPYNDLELQKCN
jgi:hypothetical protein